MIKNIEPIISPKSIAIVGASNRPGSVGCTFFENIIKGEYKGVVYPVNPKARSIHSVKSYPSLLDVPEPVDMAVVIVPPESVRNVIDDAAQKGVKGVVVITSGFKEISGKGIQLENDLKEAAARHGIPLLGPNCLGLINMDPQVQMNASFAPQTPKHGNIAFISQSGALCTAVLAYAGGHNIGFSKFISFGNKADVNEIDLLRYLKDDPQTDVILMYLEDITNGREFIETAREISWETKKPCIAAKSGRSPEGARAACSHTGSLAGSDMAYDAIFSQSGILRAESIDELFHFALAFSRQPTPKGNRIAILTNAGGPGIMATDAAIRHELKLATLSEETKTKLRQVLPITASVQNPVDVIGDATHQRYEDALRTIVQAEEVDGVIVILTPTAMINTLETAAIVPRVAKETEKPILCSFMGIVDISPGVRYLEQNGIPNYVFPEAAVRSMAAMVKYGNIQRYENRKVRNVAAYREAAVHVIKKMLVDRDSIYLPEYEANEILRSYGFPLLRSRLIEKENEIESAVEEIGLPVAMKINSPDIVHKLDVGGVRLNIRTIERARFIFRELQQNARKFRPDARIKGVLVEEMARGGVEIILGATRDPKFGPICMFGLGGTFVEAMKDVTFRLAPMWEISAEIMIQSIKAYSVLKGTRGKPAVDTNAIKDCLLRLSQLVSDHPEIAELDINPLVVYPKGEGCVVADSRILLTRGNNE